MSELEKRKYNRLPIEAWAEIEASWETGSTTLAELAAHFGVTTRTLQSHFEKNGTEKGSKAAEIAAAVKSEFDVVAIEDRACVLKHAAASRHQAFQNASIVESLIMAQLEKAQKSPAEAHQAAAAIKALSLAAQALERTHAMKERALGVTNDELIQQELPIIQIVDVTLEDIARQRQLDGWDENDEPDIKEFIEDEIIETVTAKKGT